MITLLTISIRERISFKLIMNWQKVTSVFIMLLLLLFGKVSGHINPDKIDLGSRMDKSLFTYISIERISVEIGNKTGIGIISI